MTNHLTPNVSTWTNDDPVSPEPIQASERPVTISAGYGSRTQTKTVLIDSRFEAALKPIADALCKSPQQRELFQKAMILALEMVKELGVENTILPAVRAEVAALQKQVAVAERASRELGSVAYAPENLDDRGRAVVALTGCLLKQFKDGLPGDDRKQENVAATVARSVSYIVWAYATGSTSLPSENASESEVAK